MGEGGPQVATLRCESACTNFNTPRPAHTGPHTQRSTPHTCAQVAGVPTEVAGTNFTDFAVFGRPGSRPVAFSAWARNLRRSLGPYNVGVLGGRGWW